MKKRSMLAVASLAVGFAASLAAPSAAHADSPLGDSGAKVNSNGNSLPVVGQVSQLLGNHGGPAVSSPTAATEGMLGGE
ncbi:hypothetical protein [Kitasatospora sp. LaBMicrA B282]|uniref:hypothetical protein n=1 Tax=Kitasatospora sp. LaBMicrA B282 TaxID=3420949 RepID=UPI003D0992CA